MQTNPNKPSKGGLFHRLRQCFSSTSTGKPSANQTIEKKDTQKGSIPEKYICSITGKIMAEPYTDLDGNNYDRVAIEKWLQTRSCSPVTLKPLRKEDLFPNLKLKESIDADRSALASTLIGEESFNFDTITYTEQDVNMDPISLRLSCHEINEEERYLRLYGDRGDYSRRIWRQGNLRIIRIRRRQACVKDRCSFTERSR